MYKLPVLLALLLLPAVAHAADATLSWTFDLHNTDATAIPAPPVAGSLTQTTIEYGTCVGSGTTRSFGTKAGQMTTAYPMTSLVVSMVVVQEYCFRGFVTNTYGVNSAVSNIAWKANAPPTPNPPVITLTSIAPTVYRQRDTVDGFTLVAFGTAPLGTPCNPALECNGLHVIPRAAVTPASKFDTLPLKVFAQCS